MSSTYTQTPSRFGALLRQIWLPGLIALIAVGAASCVAAFVLARQEAPVRVHGPAKDYGLPRTEVDMALQKDGSVRVHERITMDFNGSFSGAYRDIPLRDGDEITGVDVDEHNGSTVTYRYQPGGNTELGSYDAPNRFGTVKVTDGDEEALRIVWHYSAAYTQRTFRIRYTAHGWTSRAKGSDEVVLAATPWGSEWKATLQQLDGVLELPEGTTADPDTRLYVGGSGAAHLEAQNARDGKNSMVYWATDVAPGELVEVLAILPADTVTAELPENDGTVAQLTRLGQDVVDDSRARESRWEWLQINGVTAIIVSGVLGLLLGGVLVLISWRRSFRELPWPEDVPPILDSPPDDTPPALAANLVDQTSGKNRDALVATIFDLIRRDYWTTLPASSDTRGARVDIALKVPKKRPEGVTHYLYEQSAARLVDRIVAGHDDGVALGGFRKLLKNDLTLSRAVASEEDTFHFGVQSESNARGWFQRANIAIIGLAATVSFIVAIATIPVMLGWDKLPWMPADHRIWSATAAIMLPAAVGVLVVSALTIGSEAVRWRWTAGARPAAARWTAYRNYLDSYGDMGDEETASIELWERHLVYAIAFGCADDILNAVRPEGATAAASGLATMQHSHFDTFSHGLATRTPEPSSSGSGGGGGFGGGGGGFSGGGGGGGGAW